VQGSSRNSTQFGILMPLKLKKQVRRAPHAVTHCGFPRLFVASTRPSVLLFREAAPHFAHIRLADRPIINPKLLIPRALIFLDCDKLNQIKVYITRIIPKVFPLHSTFVMVQVNGETKSESRFIKDAKVPAGLKGLCTNVKLVQRSLFVHSRRVYCR